MTPAQIAGLMIIGTICLCSIIFVTGMVLHALREQKHPKSITSSKGGELKEEH